jgi:rod shape-determining protein MreD
MILRPGQPLLMPANPLFVWFSLLLALVLNILPSASGLGAMAALPDPLALTLVFWSVHQSRRIGVGVAFCLGLLVDVHQSALLGQHALCYTVLSYLAVTLHRRLPWFSVTGQALHVLPLFASAHGLELLVRLGTGGTFPGWTLLLAPVLEALLWPLVSALLLLPQRMPPDPDKHRPL